MNCTRSTWRVWKQTTYTTCGHLRFRYTFWNDFKESCDTCHETTISTPIPSSGINIPSVNMHQRAKHFVENITGIGSNPNGNEMDVDKTNPKRTWIFGFDQWSRVGLTIPTLDHRWHDLSRMSSMRKEIRKGSQRDDKILKMSEKE